MHYKAVIKKMEGIKINKNMILVLGVVVVIFFIIKFFKKVRKINKLNMNYTFSHVILKNMVFENKQKIIENLFLNPEKEEEMLKELWSETYQVKSGKIDENSSYWIIELPEPKDITECKYIGITYSRENQELKYFTLEKTVAFTSKSDPYRLCGWDKETHYNYGESSGSSFEEFLDFLTENK